MREFAEDVLEREGVAGRDQWGEVEALFNFVREHLRFTNDPNNVEMLTDAEGLLLDHRCADCDEYVILLGSLLESVGRRVRIKVVRRGTSGPWQHVYLEARIGTEWVPVDPSHPDEAIGWEVPHRDFRTILVDGPDNQLSVAGLGWAWVVPLITTAVSAFTTMSAQKKQEKAQEKAAKKAAKEAEKQQKRELKLIEAQAAAASALPAASAPALPIPPERVLATPAPATATPSFPPWQTWLPWALGGAALVALLGERRHGAR